MTKKADSDLSMALPSGLGAAGDWSGSPRSGLSRFGFGFRRAANHSLGLFRPPPPPLPPLSCLPQPTGESFAVKVVEESKELHQELEMLQLASQMACGGLHESILRLTGYRAVWQG